MAETAASPVMAPTGERMVPESAYANTFWEHVYRYRFASQFVRGKKVLDIASGEGYGSAALAAAGAASVIGIDISEEAVRHARSKYKVDARVGDGENIPLENDSIDLVVSFETIEHVPSPAKFIAELCRVLKPGGEIILSTPVLETYGTQNDNEHHVSELPERESIELFGRYFSDVNVYAQRPHHYATWLADSLPSDGAFTKFRKAWQNFVARLSVRSGRVNRLYGVDRYRGRTLDAVTDPAGNRLPLNPYRVRPRNHFGPLGPQYLVLLGKNKK